jgi:hypothetical protein
VNRSQCMWQRRWTPLLASHMAVQFCCVRMHVQRACVAPTVRRSAWQVIARGTLYRRRCQCAGRNLYTVAKRCDWLTQPNDP